MQVLGHFLWFARYSKNPTNVFLPELVMKYNFVFFFGDRDWMDVDSVREELKKLPEGNLCEE